MTEHSEPRRWTLTKPDRLSRRLGGPTIRDGEQWSASEKPAKFDAAIEKACADAFPFTWRTMSEGERKPYREQITRAVNGFMGAFFLKSEAGEGS